MNKVSFGSSLLKTSSAIIALEEKFDLFQKGRNALNPS
jgi:hypothetical protein